MKLKDNLILKDKSKPNIYTLDFFQQPGHGAARDSSFAKQSNTSITGSDTTKRLLEYRKGYLLICHFFLLLDLIKSH